jgi:hypothetical protein
METNLDKWQDYVKAKNIGKTTEQRCFGLLQENGLMFFTEDSKIITSLRVSGTRFHDRNSQGTINRVTKICQDFIKTLTADATT